MSSPPRRRTPDRRLGVFLGGVMLLAFAAIGATVVLPITDPALDETTGSARSFGTRAQRGMELYASEGCWYCHTQQVRDGTRADAMLGDPLGPGDYADQDPALLGEVRVGPDLTHVGSRYEDAEELVALLHDPRAEGRRSQMPSYDHLSSEELGLLAEYLLTLK